MRNEIPEAELCELFRAVETGAVRLRATVDPQEVYAGNVEYRATNGWTVVIFNDCNEYDYVDEVRDPAGRVTDFDAIERTAADWQPDDETAWRCLGIPGYCTFRCVACGALLHRRGRDARAFLCGEATCEGKRTPPQGTWVTRVQD